MENKIKRYLDRVLMELVNGTILDYENKKIHYPFETSFSSFLHFSFPLSLLPSFSKYCKNTFGLTEEEIKYVWEIYKGIILDKIENG